MKTPVQLLEQKLSEIKAESERLLKTHNESTDVNFRAALDLDLQDILRHQRLYESHINLLKIWV